MREGLSPIVLAAHGSRDPRSARVVRRVASRVATRWPAPVRPAFLEFNEPSVSSAVRAGAGSTPIVVPLLLTNAYHGRVDLSGVLADTGVVVALADVLGPADPSDRPDHRLIAALVRRLSDLGHRGLFDGLVLIAAGTSHLAARSTVDGVADALSAALSTVHHIPCKVGYASASGPTPADAVATLRADGAARVVAASYFLAPGRLYDAAAASARSAGARDVAAPLGAATELVDLIVDRAQAAARQPIPQLAVR